MQKRTKISEVLEQNTQPSQTTEKESANNNLHILKTALAGLTAGTVETLPMAAGFLVNAPKIMYNAAKYPFTDEMQSPIEILSPLTESKLISVGEKGGDWVRQKFGINDLSKLTPSEQAAYMAGDFAPIIATGGSYGAIKAGSAATKVAGRAAVKTLAKKGASLSAKKALYKKGATVADTILGMAAPGIQVSKKASIPSKIVQAGLQSVPEIAGNELLHLNAENAGIFGDYTKKDPEEITLIKDKRKIGKKEYIDQLGTDLYKQYEINEALNKEKKNKFLQNTLAFAAVTGAGVMTARYTGYGAKLAQKVKEETLNSTGYNRLSSTEKLDFATANRNVMYDDLVKNKFISEEDRNAMYRDLNNVINRVWEEGVIKVDNIDIDLGVKPQEFYNKLKNLTQLTPDEAKRFNNFLENTRYIQDEAYKRNKQFKSLGKEEPYKTVNDFVGDVIGMSYYGRDANNLVGIYSRIINNAKFIGDVYSGKTNQLIKSILNDLSTVNNKLLDYYESRNYISAEQKQQMLNNRTMRLIRLVEPENKPKYFEGLTQIVDGKSVPIDLNLYKPAIARPELGLIDRFKYFINKAAYSDNSLGYLAAATPRNMTDNLKVSEDLINVFEQTIKSNIYNVEKNYNINRILKNYSENNLKQLRSYITENIDEAEKLWQEVEEYKPNDVNDFFGTSDSDKYIKALDEYNKFIEDTTKYIVKHMEAKYLGSKDIISSAGIEGMKAVDIKQRLLSQLNHPNVEDSKLVENIKNNFDFGNPLSEISNTQERPGIIRTIENGKLQIYQVDPLYAKAMVLEPTISNVIGRGFYLLKNFQQSTLTGKFNPFFSGRSAIYTAHEAITALPTLTKLLNLGKISRLDYFKECFKNIKNLYAEEKAKYLARQWEQLANDPINNINIDKADLKTIKKSLSNKSQTNAIKERLTQVLQANANNEDLNLIHLMQDGGATQNKPYNTTNERVVVLDNKTRITPKLFNVLSKIHTPQGAKKLVDIINMMQNILRDAPALSVNTLLYKKMKSKMPVDIETGKIKMDQKMLDKLAYTINTNIANSSLYGAGNGVLGGLSEFIRNYFSYGAVTINSIAPKLRALGIGKGIKNGKDLFFKLIDKNVTYSDILDHMGMMYRGAKGNEYIKSLIYVSVIPSIISYIWNHGSEDNINSYYSYSDSNKGSKFILTNVFGKGRHLVIPKDQELALSDSIVYAVLDNTLHMSKYNPNDPNFKASAVISETLARSMGLDGNPTLNIIANAQGYNFSANIFDDRAGITKLTKNVVNNDLSETAYQNGWANQQVTNIINNIFGTLGSALMLSAEEAKVGARKGLGTASIDATMAFLDRTFGNSSLIPVNFDVTRATSATTQTVQDVYKTRNLLEKISTIKNKTPQQEAIYDLIKMYNRNRIEPIKKQITELRQNIIQVKANGKTPDGKLHSLYSRRNNINELNNKLKELFRNEYNEYNKLDNLIKQEYGNDISLDNFMEKFSNLNGVTNE